MRADHLRRVRRTQAGELFALEWGDIDFEAMRVDVKRRVYKGRLDLPKSNRPRRDGPLGTRETPPATHPGARRDQ
jgi:hypothetical protein